MCELTKQQYESLVKSMDSWKDKLGISKEEMECVVNAALLNIYDILSVTTVDKQRFR